MLGGKPIWYAIRIIERKFLAASPSIQNRMSWLLRIPACSWGTLSFLNLIKKSFNAFINVMEHPILSNQFLILKKFINFLHLVVEVIFMENPEHSPQMALQDVNGWSEHQLVKKCNSTSLSSIWNILQHADGIMLRLVSSFMISLH